VCRGLAHAGFQPTADVQPHHLLGALRTTRAVAVGWLVVLALVAGVIAVLTAVVVPRFLVDLPEYVRSLDVNLGGKIAGQLASWNIAIDVGDLKLEAVECGRGHLGQSFDLAKRAGTNVVLLIVAFVITFIITHGRITRARSGAPGAEPEDLWRFLSVFMRQKIGSFYGFFRLVMAVQVVAALAFLVIIHKLEYFLNGKIIGNIVKLPMYMTLLGLIVGEALFGISGMDRETELDDRRIEPVDRVRQLDGEGLVQIERARRPNETPSKIPVDAPIAGPVRIRQGRARHAGANAMQRN
jgi:hypothetical protein